MSKISNALNMYFYLQVRGKMKVSEIAEKLELTPRMVKQYKNDLEMAGIYICSTQGRNGGYYIENKRSIEGIDFSTDELSALKMALQTIQSGSYHYSTKFEILTSKILNFKKFDSEEYYFNKSITESEEIAKKQRGVWVDLNLAINQSRKIKINYKSLRERGVEVNVRIVNPYGIFDYKGAAYFYGYCEKAEDIRFFKLSRVLEYKVLNDKFKIKVDFDFSDVMKKSFGIYNDEIINLKLKIYYPMSEIIKEKQFSKDQTIVQIDDKTILFEAKIKGYTEIMSWVMSMGSKVEIIEPLKLKEDILNEIGRIKKVYK